MPVLFIGHGSPMNAIEDNVWSRAFRELGGALQAPRAILAISAHWCTRGTFVTGNAQPDTIHDFGGFPDALYEVRYPAPGDPALAGRVIDLLGRDVASARMDWGLDHGSWSVLRHMRPEADCPVVQLSLDTQIAPEQHVAIGRALAPLRDEGVLILASGNIVHNLRDAFSRMHSGDAGTPLWARDFDQAVVEGLERRDPASLCRILETDKGRVAHPSLDHYLPLLYAAGASGDDSPAFPIEGFDLGSLSMRAVRFDH